MKKTTIEYPQRLFSFVLKCIISFCCLAGLFVFNVHADEPQHLRKSIRALGMGTAFVAVANDENALFYNPAGLQSLTQHIVEIITFNTTTGQNFVDLGQTPSEDRETAIGELAGKKLFMETSLGLMSISGPGWGYSAFGGSVLDLTIHNPTVPYAELKAYLQYGIIGGLAFDFLDEVLDIGFNVKTVYRNGIGKEMHLVDLIKYADDANSEFDELSSEFATKTAFSPDLGVIYHLDQIYNLETKVALVARDIGGMDFGSSGEIPMTMEIGSATESELAGFDIIMAADYIDILNEATTYRSSQRNLKMGVEIGFWKRTNGHHFLSFRIGSNGTYPTFGFSLNPPYIPIKIDYAKWSEEVGYLAGDTEDKRQSLQITIVF